MLNSRSPTLPTLRVENDDSAENPSNHIGQVKATGQRTQGQALRVPDKNFFLLTEIFSGKKLFAGNLDLPSLAFFVA